MMNFSHEWNERYKERSQLSIWPWSDLVSYVMRYTGVRSKTLKVLELGCGAGANIPFFQALGVHYYAIEGSDAIVKTIHERFPALKEKIVVGDFTQKFPFAEKFDLIIDRASLTHNSLRAIQSCIKHMHDHLEVGGKFIGIDWFSTMHSDAQLGDMDGDVYTRNNIARGQFTGVGRVHFSDKMHIQELFAGFSFEIMEHKIIRQEIPENNHTFASWNFVAVKKV